MMRELAIALVLLFALASGQDTDAKKPNAGGDSLSRKNAAGAEVKHYDWKQWFSKTGDPSEAKKDGQKNWNKWMSFSYIDPPSGLSEEYSFKPYNWKEWITKDANEQGLLGSNIPREVQYYDWQQWLSKTGGKSGGSGKDGAFDWKKFLSNSYNKIPSGLEEKYSFSPFDWEKFLSGSFIPTGVQHYDWQQWLSKSGGSGKDGDFDWKKFLSNSYIPSGVQYYDWQQWLSKSGGSGKDGDFDWKKFLSNSYIPSGVQYYDWQQWLSKTGDKSGGSGKDGGFDWKKFLSNSYNEIPSGLEEKYSFSPFDWKKHLSYIEGKAGGLSKGAGN